MATPLKSAAPLSTIGGEPGGRPAIVIEDNAIQDVVPADGHTTSVIVGRPEPGHDIFAGEPVKDIKSIVKDEPIIAAEESKLISSVATQATTILDQDDEETKDVSSTSLESTTAGSVVEVLKEDDPQTTDKFEVKKPLGPLGEEEVEAEKAAQELYPDDAS